MLAATKTHSMSLCTKLSVHEMSTVKKSPVFQESEIALICSLRPRSLDSYSETTTSLLPSKENWFTQFPSPLSHNNHISYLRMLGCCKIGRDSGGSGVTLRLVDCGSAYVATWHFYREPPEPYSIVTSLSPAKTCNTPQSPQPSPQLPLMLFRGPYSLILSTTERLLREQIQTYILYPVSLFAWLPSSWRLDM